MQIDLYSLAQTTKNYDFNLDFTDFLCPVSKEQVAAECGLTGSGGQIQVTENDYLITDLNPNTLGLNLSEAEIITSDHLFSDDLNFQCYELSSDQ